MWLRFFSISLFRWILNMVAVSALLRFVIPSDWSGNAMAVPVWILSFLLAFALAEWAFRGLTPKKNEVALLLVNWIIINLTLDILFAYYILGSVLVAINAMDHWVTYMVEIAAIFLAAYVTRRRHVRQMLSEGIEL